MLKEASPIAHTNEKHPRSYIKECFVRFMQQTAIGTHPEEMGLTTREALRIVQFLVRNGIEIPINNTKEVGWGATPMERRISCVLGNGNVTKKAAAKALGISNTNLRAHMSNMRIKGYPLPNIPREKRFVNRIT